MTYTGEVKARRNEASRAWHRNNPARVAWAEMAHAQYLAAEADTNGYLLNKRGLAAGIDPWSLWSGSLARVEAYASWELLRFWETHQRVTFSQFREQVAREDDAERDAWEMWQDAQAS